MKIAFDLDNTLIPNGSDFRTEEPQRKFLAKLLGCERLRIGTKEIFEHCQSRQWQTWIYTTSFRTPAYIRMIFWLYGIKLDGVINQKKHSESVKNGASKYPPQYGIDYLVDDSKGVKIEGDRYGFNVILVEPEDINWVDEIKNVI